MLWELAAFANEDGGWARPGVRLLADRVGLAKDDTIAPALKWGRQHHWIYRSHRGNWRRKQADVYCLIVPVRFAPDPDLAVPEALPVTDRTSTPPSSRPEVRTGNGLTKRETEEMVGLGQAYDEWLDSGKNPYAYPQGDYQRMERLRSKWRRGQYELEQEAKQLDRE